MDKETGVRIAMLLAMVLCVGCSSVQRPTARVEQVAVTEQTPQGLRVEFTVALENPGDTPLPIRETRYSIELGESAKPFTFTDKTVATIPANGVQTLTFPAAFADGDASGRPYHLTGAVVYEPPGEFRRLLTESRIPLPFVEFSATGNLEP